MTSYDDTLAALGDRIDNLGPRARSAFFAACAHALADEYDTWARATGEPRHDTIDRAIVTGRAYAIGGLPNGAQDLLAELEANTPSGEAIGDIGSTFAQDAWICADAAVRVIAEPDAEAGPWVEYALEPRVTLETEARYGVSQLGTVDEDDIDLVVTAPPVREALDFADWAITHLETTETLTDEDFDQLARRAYALRP